MDITTENEIFRAIERLTPEQLELCAKDGEWLYEALTNDYLAQVLTSVRKICGYAGYEAMKLALEKSDEFNIALYNLAQSGSKIQYVINNSTLYYEVPD